MPEINLDTINLTVYEVGAAVLTALTHSEPRDTEKLREHVQISLCSWAIHSRAESDSSWACEPTAMKPLYAAWPDAEVNRDIARLNRRMRDRMIAARMVIVFLKTAESGEIPRANPPIDRLTVNSMAEWVLPTDGEGDAANVKTRVWRPSVPVLHLAAAFAVAQRMYEKHGVSLDWQHLLWEPQLIAWIVAEAEKYEHLLGELQKSGKLKLDLKSLVRVRLVPEPGSKIA